MSCNRTLFDGVRNMVVVVLSGEFLSSSSHHHRRLTRVDDGIFRIRVLTAIGYHDSWVVIHGSFTSGGSVMVTFFSCATWKHSLMLCAA